MQVSRCRCLRLLTYAFTTCTQPRCYVRIRACARLRASRTHTFSNAHTHSHTHTFTLSRTQTHTHTLTHSRTLTHTHTHTHTILTCTRVHTLARSRAESGGSDLGFTVVKMTDGVHDGMVVRTTTAESTGVSTGDRVLAINGSSLAPKCFTGNALCTGTAPLVMDVAARTRLLYSSR